MWVEQLYSRQELATHRGSVIQWIRKVGETIFNAVMKEEIFQIIGYCL